MKLKIGRKMCYLDIIILIVLLYGAYKGFTNGLIVEIAKLVALILGVYVAIKFSGYTEEFLVEYFNIQTKYLDYIALGLTFLLVTISIVLLGKLVTKLVDMVALGFINKLSGSIFGAAKVALFLCVLLLLVDVLNQKFEFISKEVEEGSLFYAPFLTFARTAYNYIRF